MKLSLIILQLCLSILKTVSNELVKASFVFTWSPVPGDLKHSSKSLKSMASYLLTRPLIGETDVAWHSLP